MPDEFDAYHVWLGIPPEDQPPNFYQLLGISVFESEPEVIENASDRRMLHVRSFQHGPRGLLSQKLLSEIATARLTLPAPQKKSAYDRSLREVTGKSNRQAPPVPGMTSEKDRGSTKTGATRNDQQRDQS